MKRVLRNISEIELVALANDSNKTVSNQAFEEIYKRFNKHLRYFILKKMNGSEVSNDDREDILQVVFERAFSNMKTFQTKFKISTWLMRIANNHIIDIYRKKGLDLQREIYIDEEGNETTLEVADYSHVPESQYIAEQKKNFVHNLIETKLSGDYKTIVKLVFIEGNSYKDVAKELDIPLGTVKAKIYRAKELLREGLIKEEVLTM